MVLLYIILLGARVVQRILLSPSESRVCSQINTTVCCSCSAVVHVCCLLFIETCLQTKLRIILVMYLSTFSQLNHISLFVLHLNFEKV